MRCLLAIGLDEEEEAAAEAESFLNPSTETRRIGDYELLEEIARGGMGIVYRARQISLNRVVAVKMLLTGAFGIPEFVRRFRTEAEAAASLQHPNIVPIHEFGHADGQYYLVMDYVEGRNLGQLVRQTPPSPRQAAEYLETIAAAVHYAHGQGILHRDLKSTNILVDLNNQVRITDFGLAKRLASDSDLTLTGQTIGSPAYSAPEQVTGRHHEVGPHSDVYSLGAMLYEMLTGRPPFVGDSIPAVLQQVQEREVVSPRLLNPAVPKDLESICLKCLEKEWRRRYPSADALAADLGRFLRKEPTVARPIHVWGRLQRWCKRKPVVAGLTATSMLVFLLGFAGVLWQWREAQARRVDAEREAARADATADRLRTTLVRSDFSAANDLFEMNRSGEALAHLARALRNDPEYRPAAMRLMSALTERGYCLDLRKPLEQRAIVHRLALNESGDRVITLDAEGAVWIWDSRAGTRVAELEIDTPQKAFHLLPNTDRMITIGEEGGAWLWETRTGRRVREIQPITEWLSRGDISRLNSEVSLFTGYTGERELCVGRFVQGELREPFEILGADFHGYSVSEEASRLAAATPGGSHVFWDLATRQRLGEIEGPPFQPFWGHNLGTLAPDGNGYVFWEPDQRTLNLIDLSDPALRSRRFSQTEGFASADDPAAAIRSSASWFSRDSKLLVSILFNTDRSACWGITWDLATGQRLAGFEQRGITTSVMNRQSGLFAVVVDGHQPRVWNVETWRETAIFPRSDQPLEHVFLSPEGGRLGTVTEEGGVRLWDLGTGMSLTPEIRSDAPLASLAFSPDGGKLFIASYDETVRLWNSRTGEPLGEPVRLGAYGILEGFSRDGRQALVYEQVWHEDAEGLTEQLVGRGVLVSGMPRHGLPAQVRLARDWEDEYVLGLPGDGTRLTALQGASDYAAFRIRQSRWWMRDPLSGRLLHEITLPLAEREHWPDIAFERLAVVEGTQTIHVYRLRTEEKLGTFTASAPVQMIWLSRNGAALLSLDQNEEFCLWEVDTGRRLAAVKAAPMPVRGHILVSDDVSCFGFINPDEASATVWNTRSDQPGPIRINPSLGAGGFALSPRGRYILAVTGALYDIAQLFDTTTGDLLRDFHHGDMIRDVDFSPEESRVLVAGSGRYRVRNHVKIWDTATGRLVGEPMAFDRRVVQARFLGGRDLAIAASMQPDSLIKIWDVETGNLIAEPWPWSMEGLLLSDSGCGILELDGALGFNVNLVQAKPSRLMLRLLPECPVPVPDWLPDLAEAVAGTRFDDEGLLEALDRWKALERLESLIEPLDPENPYVRTARWLFTDPADRTLNPETDSCWGDQVSQLLSQEPLSDRELHQVLLLDPTNTTALARLAFRTAHARARAHGPGSTDTLPSPQRWRSPAIYYSNLATNLAPSSAEVWWTRAEVLQLEGKTDAAEHAVVRALKLDERLGDAWLTRAFILEQKGDAEGACRAFRRSLVETWLLPPQTGVVHDLLREVKDNRFAPASDLARAAVAWADKNQHTGRRDAAEWLLRVASESVSDHVAELCALAESGFRLGRLEAAEQMLERAVRAGAPSPLAWRLEGQLAQERGETDRAMNAYRKGSELAADPEKPDDLERKECCERLAILEEGTGKLSEARRTRLRGRMLRRSPMATAWQIDLTEFYTAAVDEDHWHVRNQHYNLQYLTSGLVNFPLTGDIEFDLRGIMQLAGHCNAIMREEYPERIDGIPVNRRLDRLQILQATGFADIARSVQFIPVARLIVHYRSGREPEQIQFVPGRNTWDWELYPSYRLPPEARVVWKGTTSPELGTLAQLYWTTWENPHPDDEVTHLDYVSEMNNPVHFITAITAESDAWLALRDRLRQVGESALSRDWSMAGELAAEIVRDRVFDIRDFQQQLDWIALELALCLVKGGQTTAYLALCDHLLHRLSPKPNLELKPEALSRVAQILALSPDAPEISLNQALQLAVQARETFAPSARWHSLDFALALVSYRQGRYEDALRLASEAAIGPPRPAKSFPVALAALAAGQLGNTRRAELLLALADHLLEAPAYEDHERWDWRVVTLAGLVIQEARALIGPVPEPVRAALDRWLDLRQQAFKQASQGNWDECAQLFVQLMREPDFDPWVLLALDNWFSVPLVGSALVLAQRFDDHRFWTEQLFAVPEGHIPPVHFADACSRSILVGGRRLDPARARQVMAKIQAALDQGLWGKPFPLAYPKLAMAMGAVCLEDWDQVQRWTRLPRAWSNPGVRGTALALQAIALAHTGDRQAATDALQAAEAILDDILVQRDPGGALLDYPGDIMILQIWVRNAEAALDRDPAVAAIANW